MEKYNRNTMEQALVLRKEFRLTTIHHFSMHVIRVSSKALFFTFALTLLNLFI